jgi:glucokinase-like ROK family protein
MPIIARFLSRGWQCNRVWLWYRRDQIVFDCAGKADAAAIIVTAYSSAFLHNMKKTDLTQILKLIFRHRPISRVTLAKELGFTPGYITTIVQHLLEKNLLVEEGFAASKGGRRQVLLHINPELAHLVGFDFGTANLRLVVTDFLGQVLSFQKVTSEAAQGKDHCLQTVNRMIKACAKKDGAIKAIGIAHSGVINQTDGSVLFWPKVYGWEKVPLKEIIEQACGLPALVEDSSRTMALAEQRYGLGKGAKEWIHVSFGMGIGSAIFANGQLCRGHNGLAGELGHITINENGELCSCGNRGCLEVFASGLAIIEKIRTGLRKGVTSSLFGLGDQQLTIEAIVMAGRAGDRLSTNVLMEAGTHLGTALADIVNLLNPQKIILGGSVPRIAQALLLDPMMLALRQRAFHQSVSELEVAVSQLGEEAAAVGAAQLAAESLLEASLDH